LANDEGQEMQESFSEFSKTVLLSLNVVGESFPAIAEKEAASSVWLLLQSTGSDDACLMFALREQREPCDGSGDSPAPSASGKRASFH
jgi:hypothetical protein